MHLQKNWSGLKLIFYNRSYFFLCFIQFPVVLCTACKCLFHHNVVLNKTSMAKQGRLILATVTVCQTKTIEKAPWGKGKKHVQEDCMWRFALELDEIQPAIWSCCCIVSSFTIQTEVTACPVPEGASAPTDFGQAWWHGLAAFLWAAHSTEVLSPAQAGTHQYCLCCLWCR